METPIICVSTEGENIEFKDEFRLLSTTVRSALDEGEDKTIKGF